MNLVYSKRLGVALVSWYLASGVVAANGIDGVVSPFEYGAPLAVQDTPTGFGNNLSELNAAFANLSPAGDLKLALTGNLEGNGNGLVIFFDTRAGGAVTTILPGGFGQLGAFGGQRVDDWGNDIDGSAGVFNPPGGPSILDPGFDPDFAVEFNVFGGTRFVNIIDLTVPNDPAEPTRDIFLGSVPVGSGPVTQFYAPNGGQITHDFDNSNTMGVNGLPGPLGDPLSATTGFEFQFSAAFLDADPGHVIKILPFLTNGGGDFLSNQFLPGLGGVDNLGFAGGLGGVPLFDAREFDGDQFLVIEQVQAIPEPGTFGLLLAGTVAGLARRWWQRR